MDNNLVKYGICKVKCHPITAIDTAKTDGTGYTYGTPFAIPGAIAVNLPNDFASQIVWADNKKYKVIKANHGYNGSVNVVLLPAEFEEQILGDVNGVENADAKMADFGLAFEFNGDVNAGRVFLYHCALTQRPGIIHNTETDSLNVDSDTLNIEVSPRLDTGDIKIKQLPGDSFYDTLLDTPPNPVTARGGVTPQENNEENNTEEEPEN